MEIVLVTGATLIVTPWFLRQTFPPSKLTPYLILTIFGKFTVT